MSTKIMFSESFISKNPELFNEQNDTVIGKYLRIYFVFGMKTLYLKLCGY